MSLLGRINGFMQHQAAVAAIRLLPAAKVTKTVFLAGSGRSGTTWLAGLINHRKDYRIVFEPFHPRYVKRFSHFNQRQYLHPGNHDPANLTPLADLMAGRIRNRWVDARVSTFFTEKLLIKDIRANLLLPWIHHNYPETRMVLLLRHPCAVIQSRLQLGWGTGLKIFTDQEELVSDYLEPVMGIIRGAKSEVAQMTVAWCIENYIPLIYFNTQQLLVCYYENLASDTQREMDHIMEHIGDERAFLPAGLITRSSDTNFNKADHSAAAGHGKAVWHDKFSKKELDTVFEILDGFGMGGLYDGDGRPLRPELIRKG